MFKIVLASVFAAFPALADPVMVAQVAIVDGSHESELAVVLPSNGEPSELIVNGPITIKLKLSRAPLGLEFDVEQIAADHSSFRARGEVSLPAVGKRVVVARVPRPTGGATEVQLTLR